MFTVLRHPERGWLGLPSVSKYLYEDTYFLPGEVYEAWLVRTTNLYSNDSAHAERMSTYISNYWFHPSTPISTSKGLPISCFTGMVPDSKEGIFQSYDESNWLGSHGGGLGWEWSQVREVGHAVGSDGGTSSGVIPFLGISDRSTLAISQGGSRRASQAVYLNVSHPEIEEFIELRKPVGDQNRRCPNLHHGVNITDAFMEAVINDQPWNLISPKSGEIIKTVSAKYLFNKILDVRTTLKGEPYLNFIDTVNLLSPFEYKHQHISVITSNLCTEITLRTDETHSGVCCLGSINLEYWDEYSAPDIFDQFIADCSDFLDNVLQVFIDKTKDLPGFQRARNGAIDERSIGLGVMGDHSLLQSKLIPIESPMAKALNIKIHKAIAESAHKHNISSKTSICPMAQRSGTTKRNIHVTAIAPTMSISNLCNMTSSGIEPWLTNHFVVDLKQGSFTVTNKYLKQYIINYATEHDLTETWVYAQWKDISKHQGSVQQLPWMDPYTKSVFKTAYEIDQSWLIERASDRQQYVDQAQSLNLFIPGNSHVNYIADLHILAWKKKVKSLYYLRSTAVNRASAEIKTREAINISDAECLSCQ